MSDESLSTLNRELLNKDFKKDFDESYKEFSLSEQLDNIPNHHVLSCKTCYEMGLDGTVIRSLFSRAADDYVKINFTKNAAYIEELARSIKNKKKKLYFFHNFYDVPGNVDVIMCKDCKCAELVKIGSKQVQCTRCKNDRQRKKKELVYISYIEIRKIGWLGAIIC